MRVLVVDAEPGIGELLELHLRRRWPQASVVSARSGAEGLAISQREPFSLVVLEASLPDVSGELICQAVRSRSDVPIVFLTASGDCFDRARGLEVGADDCLTKPWDPAELLARVQAVLRRARPGPRGPAAGVRLGGLQVYFDRPEVRVDGQPVRLTAIEHRLLCCLVENAGRVLTHDTLTTRVWGEAYTDRAEYLKIHVQRLRRKLGDDPRAPRMIATERGVGYRFIRPSGTGRGG